MPIVLSLFGNLAVAATTLAVMGWSSPGLHADARNTARFSAAWCAVALAGPFLRTFSTWPESRLIQAFVAAHLVHFFSVVALLLTFERTHIAERPGQSAAVIAIGSLLIVGLGLTAASARSWYKVI
jgi:hypothetical protein